jgi:hypothetical protein
MRRRDPKLARTAARAAETARQARLSAIIREHGSEAERAALLFSSLTTGGVKLTQLAAAAEGGPPVKLGSPEPELLAKLTRRVERRAKLQLPQVRCAADPPAPQCDCLERALDQPGDDRKRAVLKLAGAFHQRTKTEPRTPLPREAPAEPQEANGSADDPSATPDPEPPPKPKPKTAPPARVIHRSGRWYDEAEGRVPFDQMRF